MLMADTTKVRRANATNMLFLLEIGGGVSGSRRREGRILPRDIAIDYPSSTHALPASSSVPDAAKPVLGRRPNPLFFRARWHVLASMRWHEISAMRNKDIMAGGAGCVAGATLSPERERARCDDFRFGQAFEFGVVVSWSFALLGGCPEG